MNNILITGCNGQLGTEVSKLLPRAFKTDSKQLDITDLKFVKEFIGDNKIDTIINCSAYTAVDKAEEEKEIAEKINVLGSKNLAETGCKIIHISTDYVFNGKNYKPYESNDETNPLSIYGKTKLLGEKAILNGSKTALIIRTSWLYSTVGKNFVKTMINLGKTKEFINVVYDQIGTPTFAKDLAKVIVSILSQIKKNQKDIYHFSNEGVCSWYDFAVEIMSLYGLSCRVNPIKSSEYLTKAVRPFYSVLSKEKIKKDFNISIRHWKEALTECIEKLKELNI